MAQESEGGVRRRVVCSARRSACVVRPPWRLIKEKAKEATAACGYGVKVMHTN
jgi:hypothetical protein